MGGPLSFDGKPDGHPDPGKDTVIRMIRELGDLGVNAIDTAEQYSNGESERRVGEAIRGRRDEWVLSTKFGYRVSPQNSREDDASPETILRSLEGSLRRLNCDTIDVFLYHCPPKLKDIVPAREILEKAKEQGKIRSYGISTNDLELLKEMAQEGSVEVLQFASNLCDPHDKIWDLATQNNWGTQVRGVMAHGFLSGKYLESGPKFAADDHRRLHFKAEQYTRFSALQDLLPEGMSLAQVAIRWALDHDQANTVCMGAKNLQDYQSAIDAAEREPLSSELTKVLVAKAAEILSQ
ncbi:aldo/keto reductase [Pelagicoccus mobilis]|uniref:Aldo/keto reductase n=1 Tax=Pelagicoccus mobilis TaxID=415221 RepID=A0A934RV70_9BACT|nr:aldo/keto reductase [Pelagicoccus mobilis]